MYKALLFFAVLIHRAWGNWDAADNDPSRANLGFIVFNMTCTEDGSSCQHCFHVDAFERVFLISTEFTANPFKFQSHLTDGNNEWNMNFQQEEHHAGFRFCEMAIDMSGNTVIQELRVVRCITNRFTDISVPASCPKPVALMKLDALEYDDKVRGQQMLYCL